MALVSIQVTFWLGGVVRIFDVHKVTEKVLAKESRNSLPKSEVLTVMAKISLAPGFLGTRHFQKPWYRGVEYDTEKRS